MNDMTRRKAVVLLSGGLDSTTTLAIARNEGFQAYALTFRYGQRHEVELQAARTAHAAILHSVLHDARYAGYMQREQLALRQLAEMDQRLIPPDIDYGKITHLRHEAREKLQSISPRSLGQALRISGITPADVTVLAIHLSKHR